MPSILRSISLGLVATLSACLSHERQEFDDVDPATRMAAIRHADSARDQSAIPNLIRLLDSDDPAERLLAINTLQNLTGQTLDYNHAGSYRERAAGAERWQVWYASLAKSSEPRPTMQP